MTHIRNGIPVIHRPDLSNMPQNEMGAEETNRLWGASLYASEQYKDCQRMRNWYVHILTDYLIFNTAPTLTINPTGILAEMAELTENRD